MKRTARRKDAVRRLALPTVQMRKPEARRITEGVLRLMSERLWAVVVKFAGMVIQGYGIVIGQESVFV